MVLVTQGVVFELALIQEVFWGAHGMKKSWLP